MGADAAALEDRVGSVIAGKYRLTRVLGAGGMGAVYAADHLLLDRPVAIKLMSRDRADERATERFLREAKAAARVVHPHIVVVLDVGQDAVDMGLYIVQEFLKGIDLRHRLRESPRLTPREALEVMVPVVAALAAAHRRGVVHRDIKPENVFLARGDDGAVVPKVIDFGISKVLEVDRGPLVLTRTGGVVGTPQYMSPEQARGQRDVDARTDVWSAAAVLYECLAGRPPFVADNFNALMVAILSEDPPRLEELSPDVPAALARIVHGALTRDASARVNAAAFLRALLRCPAFEREPWFVRLAAVHLPPESPPDTPSGPPPADVAATLPPRDPDADLALATTSSAAAGPSRPPRERPPRARVDVSWRVVAAGAALVTALALYLAWQPFRRAHPAASPPSLAAAVDASAPAPLPEAPDVPETSAPRATEVPAGDAGTPMGIPSVVGMDVPAPQRDHAHRPRRRAEPPATTGPAIPIL